MATERGSRHDHSSPSGGDCEKKNAAYASSEANGSTKSNSDQHSELCRASALQGCRCDDTGAAQQSTVVGHSNETVGPVQDMATGAGE